jgi:phosphonate transport system substrate-binding protein
MFRHTKMRNRVLAGVMAAAVAVSMAGCGESASTGAAVTDPDTLVFGIIPYENANSMAQLWQPVIDVLKAETGKEINFQVVTDYAALIEGQRAKTIHLAMYGPLSYVLAKDSGAGIIPVGSEAYAKGEPSYRSYIVARAGSGIRQLSDLRGKNMCFVDPNSTSGYLYPLGALTKAGLQTSDYTAKFAGGHDASMLAVRDKDCDAGAVRDLLFDKVLPEQKEIVASDYEKIWTSDPIVNSPIAMIDTLNPELQQKISIAITEKANADALGVDAVAGFWGFMPVEDDFYNPIRDICKATQAEICKTG